MEKMRKYERLMLPEGKHLTVARHTVNGGHPQHWHSYFEIEIIISGSGKYTVNDVEYAISENDAFFLTPTDFHYLEVTDKTELLNISFDNLIFDGKDFSSLLFSKCEKAYSLKKEEYSRLYNAAEILLNEYEISGDCQKLILEYVIKTLLRKSGVSSEKVGTAEQNRGVKTAVAFMEMHFAEKITLGDAAAAAGYSPEYFSDLFRRLTGETFIEALTKLRLGYACSMLRNGASVSDACFLSGFGSLSSFLESFKKHYGIPPSAYSRINKA